VRVKGATGVTVRFAGRRIRPGRRPVVVRFTRPGRHVVTATKPGFRPARVIVRVVAV
jgi:hypothetical protein